MLGNFHILVVCCFVLWGGGGFVVVVVVVVKNPFTNTISVKQFPSRPGTLTNNKELEAAFHLWSALIDKMNNIQGQIHRL